VPPPPGTWRWSLNVVGTRVHSEHVAEEAGAPYWHVLDVTLSEVVGVTAVGVARNTGLELMVPFRTSTTHVRFEDAERRPFTPAEGDLHHRDETVAGAGDPWLMVHAARPGATWTTAARVGVSVPLGETVPNPFALGREGLPHQHVQFGTGTWDPLLGLAAGRRFGRVTLSFSGLARIALYENEHGYRAGNRYLLGAMAERPAWGAWRAGAALEWAREETERWNGRVEVEEGNLGRTDLLVTLAVLRPLPGLGAFRIAVSVPLVSRTRGSQLDYPLLLSVGLFR
jgi:hypothetical protein